MRKHTILRRQLLVVMEFVMRRVRLNAVGVAVAVVLGTLAGAPMVEAQHREPTPRLHSAVAGLGGSLFSGIVSRDGCLCLVLIPMCAHSQGV
jgi:hypothetical protein